MDLNNLHTNDKDDLLKLIQDLEKKNLELIHQNNKLSEQVLALQSEEIRLREKHKTVKFKTVTVLFSNVQGITRMADTKDAELIIDELDRFFYHFDAIIRKFNLERIKSIGDTFMCAGGIPKKNKTNPIQIIMASLEMRKYLENLKLSSEKKNLKIWDLTFGIHTGPAVINFTSKKKITHEITGDTINLATRIEAAGEIGKINISADTYEHAKDYFSCEYIGKMPVRYKGDMAMYIVKGYRPELSVDGKGIEPNDDFRTKFQHLKYEDLNEFVLSKMEHELPKHMYYHNLKHTIDVTIAVEIIGSGEDVSEEDMLVLKTAALFHDIGRIYSFDDHEKKSCEIAVEILAEFDYDEYQIKLIENLILSTKMDYHPQNLLEQIMRDADYDFLGRSDFINVTDNIYRELKAENSNISLNEWYKMQLNFLIQHDFYTATSKSMRQVPKDEQINKLNKLISNSF